MSDPRKPFNGAQPKAEQSDRTPEPEEKRVYIDFLKPSEIKSYVVPEGTVLVGDNHIVRGDVFVVGGPPGVGKSRGWVALGEAGATKLDWLGLKVHVHFRTLIIQNENGRFRLKTEFSNLDAELLDEYIRISPPPPFGLRFDKYEFRDQVKAYIEFWDPGVILIDPWNSVARDDKQKDYRETFDLIRDVVPAGDNAPAIGIAAHTRKPAPNERTSGRALLNLLAGSHVLGSVPRAVWVYQHASDDVAETRVVVTCCKNNDGQLGARSVWTRGNGLWKAATDFDWDEFDSGDQKESVEKGINERAIMEIFDSGIKRLRLAEARDALMELTGRSRATCYRALTSGRFLKHLYTDKKGLISYVP